MDWETLAGQIVGATAQVGLQFGAAYGNAWLSNSNLETQYELLAKYSPRPAPGISPITMVLIVGAFVLLARR